MNPELSDAELAEAGRMWEAMAWPVYYDGDWWRWRSGPMQDEPVPIEDFESLFDEWLQQQKRRASDIGGLLLSEAQINEELLALSFPELRKQPLSYSARGRKQFEREMVEFLKRNHAIAYIIGVGGLENMTARDRQQLVARIRSEFKYLNGFLRHLREKRSIADIIWRAEMYGNATYGTWMQARTAKAKRDGYLWKINDLDDKAQHCEGCLAIADLGWVTIDHPFPPPGKSTNRFPRQCLSRCRCRVRFSRSRRKPSERRDWLLRNRVGWLQTVS